VSFLLAPLRWASNEKWLAQQRETIGLIRLMGKLAQRNPADLGAFLSAYGLRPKPTYKRWVAGSWLGYAFWHRTSMELGFRADARLPSFCLFKTRGANKTTPGHGAAFGTNVRLRRFVGQLLRRVLASFSNYEKQSDT
jgi:hypothetical protein